MSRLIAVNKFKLRFYTKMYDVRASSVLKWTSIKLKDACQGYRFDTELFVAKKIY